MILDKSQKTTWFHGFFSHHCDHIKVGVDLFMDQEDGQDGDESQGEATEAPRLVLGGFSQLRPFYIVSG